MAAQIHCVLMLESEQWEMKVTGDELSNPIKEQNHVFGTVITRTHNLFRKGNSYKINVNHIGTDSAYLGSYGEPDYDYEARVKILTEDTPHWIQDEDSLLGIDGSSTTNGAKGKTAHLHLVKVEPPEYPFHKPNGSTNLLPNQVLSNDVDFPDSFPDLDGKRHTKHRRLAM